MGERPTGSAPTLSLARELGRLGVTVTFSEGAERGDTRAWAGLVRRNDALVHVRYDDADAFLRRQFHLAQVFGCIVVRWWVGTDVHHCLQASEHARAARALDAAVDVNLAVAPHLVEELAGIGIRAVHSPSVCDLTAAEQASSPEPLPSAVLVYLPGDRRAFYGEAMVVAAIEANPDLSFIIVSDETHTLARFPNVRSLGWVEDMESVWPQVGAVLRMTEHDGLPRIVLEALARGRYVIYAWPLPGCWHAGSAADMHLHLDCFKRATGPNAAGPEAARALAEDAGPRFLDAVVGRGTVFPSLGRARALLGAVRAQGAMKGWLR